MLPPERDLFDGIDHLFEPMAGDDLKQAAGEAFTLLTGVELEAYQLDAKVPEDCEDCGLMASEDDGEEPVPTAEALREKPFKTLWEEDLPYPDADACYLWWENHQNHFDVNQRYLAGLMINEENLLQILSTGNQRQRQLAAVYLSLQFGHDWGDPNWPG